MAKSSNQKKCLFSEFHMDDTRKTVLEYDFHNDRQSPVRGQGNLLHRNLSPSFDKDLCSLLRQHVTT